MLDKPFVLFVNGTLMRGLALHANLSGALFLGEATTAPRYRLYSIADRHPGMFALDHAGVAVAGELYEVPPAVWERVEAGEPPGLYLGTVELADGRQVQGILYPRELAERGHRDISEFANWRAYIASGSGGPSPNTSPDGAGDVTETKLPPERYQRALAADFHQSMLPAGPAE